MYCHSQRTGVAMGIDDAEKKQTNQFDAGVTLDGKSLGLREHSEMKVVQSWMSYWHGIQNLMQPTTML